MLLVKPSIGRMIAAVDADETTAAKSVPNSSLEARRSWREDLSNMTISNRWLVMVSSAGPLEGAVRRSLSSNWTKRELWTLQNE
jgi:hypothetical protein